MNDESKPTRDAIKDAIESNPVILFMKGTPRVTRSRLPARQRFGVPHDRPPLRDRRRLIATRCRASHAAACAVPGRAPGQPRYRPGDHRRDHRA
jgi:hypothetical protein